MSGASGLRLFHGSQENASERVFSWAGWPGQVAWQCHVDRLLCGNNRFIIRHCYQCLFVHPCLLASCNICFGLLAQIIRWINERVCVRYPVINRPAMTSRGPKKCHFGRELSTAKTGGRDAKDALFFFVRSLVPLSPIVPDVRSNRHWNSIFLAFRGSCNGHGVG